MILSANKPLNVPYSTSRSKLHDGYVVIDKPCSKFSCRMNQKMKPLPESVHTNLKTTNTKIQEIKEESAETRKFSGYMKIGNSV